MKQEVKDQIKSTIKSKEAAKEFIDYIDEQFILPLINCEVVIDNYYHQAIPEGGIHILQGRYLLWDDKKHPWVEDSHELAMLEGIFYNGQDDNQPEITSISYLGNIIVFITYFE